MAGAWAIGQGFSNAQTYGVSTASSGLTTITTGLTNTMGAWTQLTASTTYDANWLLLFVDLLHGNSTDVVFNFATGAAGAENIFLANLVCNWIDAQVPHLLLPVQIPAGSRIAAQAQSNNATDTVAAACILFDDNYFDFNNASAIDTIGYSNGLGTGIASGSSNNTFGAFVQLTASTANDYRGLFYALDAHVTSSIISGFPTTLLDIAVGGAGSEQVIIPSTNVGWESNAGLQGGGNPPLIGFFPCPIPAGSRLSARTCASGGSPLTTGLTVYGVR